MKLDWAWKLLFFIKLFTEMFRKHLVDAYVCEESIILLKKRALVLVLLILSPQLIQANYFGDLWNIQVLNLVLESSLWVFYKYTNFRIVFSC